jgi:hypothetical protein
MKISRTIVVLDAADIHAESRFDSALYLEPDGYCPKPSRPPKRRSRVCADRGKDLECLTLVDVPFNVGWTARLARENRVQDRIASG